MTKPRNRSAGLIRKEACADVKGSEAPDTQGSDGFRSEAKAPDTRLIHPNIGDETLPSLQEQGFELGSKDSRGGCPHISNPADCTTTQTWGVVRHHAQTSGSVRFPGFWCILHCTTLGGRKNVRSYAQCLQKRCQDYSR